jgi:hypothetical protein
MCHVSPQNVTWFLKWQVPLGWRAIVVDCRTMIRSILMDWNYAVLPTTLLELKQFREKLRSQGIILAVTLQNVQIKMFTALTSTVFEWSHIN